ncbi:uncharacterized protein LOC120119131 [Hibiscus syriacus]|uniref:uncharacterized protein LOC120119131 n=1 Tax=Hibiscus syriacus TaxID=106335 RepID=UPI001922CEDE|nr:uncharacterized protein LOC120119131 [Hibiscus syriacus]
MARFWWSHNNTKRGVHWCTWSSLSALNDEVGMGFRDMGKFNFALLAKQGWRLIYNSDSLAVRVFRAKYYPSFTFSKARLGSNPSLIWHLLMLVFFYVGFVGIYWRISTGDLESIWNNYWLPGNDKIKISTEPVEGLNFIDDMMNQSERSWNLGLLESNFLREEVDRIKMIRIPSSIIRDLQPWSGERTGLYIIRSQCMMPSEGNLVDSNIKTTLNKLWKIDYPGKPSESELIVFVEPPLDPLVKVNVDEAYLKNSQIASSECVVRDHDGQILGSCYKSSYNVESAFFAEG